MMLGLKSVEASDYTLNLMKGVTKASNDIYDLHMLILWICVFIGVAVFGTMFYSIYYHRKSKGHKAEQFHENTTIEIIWTIIPTIILIAMAIPATKLMIEMDDVSESEMSIKVTGWQWKWEYEYMDNGIHFFSSLDAKSNEARQLGSDIDPRTVDHYLLNVDKPLVIPTHTKIRFLFTAADVLHSWWVPDLGWKKDTIPGFINESWTLVEKAGTYRGQCAELCGKDHGFMPIVVIAMDKPEYDLWVKEQKALAKAEVASAEKEWTQVALMAQGKEVYTNNCASCHMDDGSGMQGTFPAIASSTIVTGDIAGEINIVMNGRGMMPAFGAMLSAADFAAVITYTRNSFGNAVGDLVQPSKIKSLQAALVSTDNEDDEDDDDDDNDEDDG
ncbi:MAG: cytochrome c oxidase subunit II [Methylococcales bacterium]|nr:cytochrome c oxidase subunit II [Methylococcales bacterium]